MSIISTFWDTDTLHGLLKSKCLLSLDYFSRLGKYLLDLTYFGVLWDRDGLDTVQGGLDYFSPLGNYLLDLTLFWGPMRHGWIGYCTGWLATSWLSCAVHLPHSCKHPSNAKIFLQRYVYKDMYHCVPLAAFLQSANQCKNICTKIFLQRYSYEDMYYCVPLATFL